MERLQNRESISIRQTKEWGEILTGFETKNKYSVQDMSGQQLYLAAEESGSFFLRVFLKAWRPFTMVIMDLQGNVVLKLQRPFTFFFHKIEISDANGVLIGKVQRQFSILRKFYKIFDSNDQEILELIGPILHPWTFNILRGGEQVGKIAKRWSGLLKEAFTDADNFGVTFPVDMDFRQKAVLLGTVFLIDFVHFENKD